MLYEKFIRLVEEHAGQITHEWVEEVKNNPATPSYRGIPDELLSKRIFDVYQRLGMWLLGGEEGQVKISEHYVRLGRERAAEGINVSEVVYALILSRAVLWKYIMNHSLIDDSLTLQQAFEFYQKIINFYGCVAYLVTRGDESYKELEKSEFEKGELI